MHGGGGTGGGWGGVGGGSMTVTIRNKAELVKDC